MAASASANCTACHSSGDILRRTVDLVLRIGGEATPMCFCSCSCTYSCYHSCSYSCSGGGTHAWAVVLMLERVILMLEHVILMLKRVILTGITSRPNVSLDCVALVVVELR